MDSFNGLLVLDKPPGITSRDAVDCAARWFPRKTRIGHTGTLDPFATGTLVLCLGATTRLAEYVQRMSKVYRSTFVLGARSDTDDIDGTLTPTAAAHDPGRAAITTALAAFVGNIEQVPPAYSAAKVSGQRAYALARQGTAVELAARTVQVHGIEVLRYEWPQLEVEVRCGKGTYIRALARDLGRQLGCGAFCATLRRTAVGPFRADDGLPMDADPVLARSRLLPAALALAELPRVVVSASEAVRLRRGQTVALTGAPDGEVGVFDEAGDAVAVATVARGEMRPAKVLA